MIRSLTFVPKRTEKNIFYLKTNKILDLENLEEKLLFSIVSVSTEYISLDSVALKTISIIRVSISFYKSVLFVIKLLVVFVCF